MAMNQKDVADLLDRALSAFDDEYDRVTEVVTRSFRDRIWLSSETDRRNRLRRSAAAAVQVVRVDLPFMAAALWNCDPEHVENVLSEAWTRIANWDDENFATGLADGLQVRTVEAAQGMLLLLERRANDYGWCDIWHRGARLALLKNMDVFMIGADR